MIYLGQAFLNRFAHNTILFLAEWPCEAVELVSRRETRSLLSLQNRSIVRNIADMP